LAKVNILGLEFNEHVINGFLGLSFFCVADRIKQGLFWSFFSDSEEIFTEKGATTFSDSHENHIGLSRLVSLLFRRLFGS